MSTQYPVNQNKSYGVWGALVSKFSLGSKQGQLCGIPNCLMLSRNHAQHMHDHIILDADAAVSQFEDLGGRITTFLVHLEDPLKHSTDQYARS